MKKNILIIALLIIIAALLLPFIFKAVGALVGLAFGFAVVFGVLFFAGFILLIVFSGAGVLAAGVIGLVGVILLALALPILAPLFIVLLPIIILIWLITR